MIMAVMAVINIFIGIDDKAKATYYDGWKLNEGKHIPAR